MCAFLSVLVLGVNHTFLGMPSAERSIRASLETERRQLGAALMDALFLLAGMSGAERSLGASRHAKRRVFGATLVCALLGVVEANHAFLGHVRRRRAASYAAPSSP